MTTESQSMQMPPVLPKVQKPAPKAGMHTYTGSCHCGAVRFEATFDLSEGGGKCNCTICRKKNYFGARVKPENFKLLAGKDSIVDYKISAAPVLHKFCKHCGVHAIGWSNIPQAGGEVYSVNVNCLDDVDVDGVKVKYMDGLHNNWWNEVPAFA